MFKEKKSSLFHFQASTEKKKLIILTRVYILFKQYNSWHMLYAHMMISLRNQ